MIHHTDLLRSNSADEQGSFVAPVCDYRNDLDCGCNALPCLTQRLNLEKCAKPGYFVGLLSLVGFFTGITVKYFRGTSQTWSQHYNLSENTIDWLIYINEVFVGIFALPLAYWGNRVHRTNWLGTLSIYLGVSCLVLVIPEIYQPFKRDETNVNSIRGRILCHVSSLSEIANLPSHINNQIIAFGILLLFQILFAFYTISFIAHGITYVDDNSSFSYSPVYIALVFAAQRLGKQAGIYSAWIPYVFNTKSIFISVVWLVVAIHIIICGCVLAMFPRVMPNILLRKSVNSLLSIASGNAINEQEEAKDGFFKSLWRILKNEILILNIVAMTLMQAAIINFNIKEKHFNQSKYHMSKYNDASGYSDPALIQFSTNLLKQPLIAVSYITVGVLIAKMKPKAKYLVCWNIIVFVLVLLSFVGIRFVNCAGKIQNAHEGRLSIPYCSWNCGCSLDGPFQPICLNGETHFSPCWAGCRTYVSTLKAYVNCSCGSNGNTVAAERACDSDNCSTLWALAQAHGVISSALLGTTFITTLIINLKCVTTKDKSLALGLYMAFVGLVPYLPVKAIYDVIADNFCQIWGEKTCQFYSENYTFSLAIVTMSLEVLAIMVSIPLLYFIRNTEFYHKRKSEINYDEEDIDLNPTETIHTETHNNKVNNNFYDDRPTILNQAEVNMNSQDPEGTSNAVNYPRDVLERSKQKSDSKLDKMINRKNCDDTLNPYLSEGDLVPPLRPNLKLGRSTSKTSNSNNSVLSTNSSLSAMANTLGDDHDSDLNDVQWPQSTKHQFSSYSPLNSNHHRRAKPDNLNFHRNIEETEF